MTTARSIFPASMVTLNWSVTICRVTIVVVSRLVYRKGVDLTAQIISELCLKHDDIHFLIAGDGPKRLLLEEIREKLGLQHRVDLLGSLEHSRVRDVLVKGDIFLNTSLTEAYCMAIVEAASCGLKVVSTKVGGIPEVLPHDLIYLTEPTVPALTEGLEKAIEDMKLGKTVCPYECNLRVGKYYNWVDVSTRTEAIYKKISKEKVKNLKRQLKGYYASEVWPFLLVVTLVYLMLKFYQYLSPDSDIDVAPDYQKSNPKKIHKKDLYN